VDALAIDLLCLINHRGKRFEMPADQQPQQERDVRSFPDNARFGRSRLDKDVLRQAVVLQEVHVTGLAHEDLEVKALAVQPREIAKDKAL
jgi:hypothetical protein